MDTNQNKPLQLGLLANAALSLTMGLLLTVAPTTVGGWLGVEVDGWLRLLGLTLVAHSAILVFVTRQRHPEQLAKLNVAVIAPYPLIMIGLAMSGLVDRSLGQVLVVADGVAVGLVAMAQVNGLRKMQTMSTPSLA